ncbi:MAG: hypothetical protein FJ263_01855 [Planctomycetes bacterium]|nr:hypothetical protein [Planctomycetota bacterium]
MRYFYFRVFSVITLLFISGCAKDENESFRKAWDKAVEATDSGRYEIAEKLWKDIAQKYPDKYMAFYNWGAALLCWGNCGGSEAIIHYQQACVQLEKAANLNPKSDMVFYNWGNACAKIAGLNPKDATEYYRQACEKYRKSTEINPDKEQAFYNWGTILSNWAQLGGPDARNKYLEAYDKFQKATSIKPDKYEAFNNWGCALVYQSKIENNNKELILRQAETMLLKSEAIKKGHSAYGLACVQALLGDEEKCKQWLKVGEEAKTLPSREHVIKDEDFASMQDKDWFKAIRWKGE